jgi:cyclin-like protein
MAESSSRIPSPPAPPSPSQDAGLVPELAQPNIQVAKLPSPASHYTDWNADTISPETAMKMLSRSVEGLAQATGEVPPTPPISRRPLTPVKPEGDQDGQNHARGHRRTLSRPGTPMSSNDIKKPDFTSLDVGTPEAEPDEPAAGDIVVESAEVAHLQQLVIARKFFCKTPPNVSIEAYLTRLQRYCPMSTAVYLAAGSYIHRLCVEDKLVPATRRTVHRLVLASLRVAMKALEDLRYSQERFSVVGGVRQDELRSLEVSLCYLTNFELQVNHDAMQKRMSGLLQAGGLGQRKENMQLRIPHRIRPS